LVGVIAGAAEKPRGMRDTMWGGEHARPKLKVPTSRREREKWGTRSVFL